MPAFNMDELKLIWLDDFVVIDDPEITKLDQRELVERRGLSLSRLFSNNVFVDEELGYAVVHEPLLTRISMPKHDHRYAHLARYHDNWTAKIGIDGRGDDGEAAPSPGQPPWYLENQEWPSERGESVTVAVLDYGIECHERFENLKKDESDFCSCAAPGSPRTDISPKFHGTRCAGVIAAGDQGTTRTSPAPACNLVAACVVRCVEYEPNVCRITISLVDLLLMLSWAIHAWNARIINMSVTIENLTPADMELLERVAEKLRGGNRALVFAAAKPDGEEVAYPARAKGIIGVAECAFYPNGKNRRPPVSFGSGNTWSKPELIFGPGSSVETVAIADTGRYFTESSAACAYVSGVAALYVERYWEADDGDLERILARMFSDARELPGLYGGRRCLVVQLPCKPPVTPPAATA